MRPHGDEGQPAGAPRGAGGLGQEGICYSALREAEDAPTPTPAMRRMPLVPPGGLQALAECPVPTLTHQPMLDTSHQEPRWAGKIFGCFSSFSAASHALQAAGRRRLAAALIPVVIFTLKRLCNGVPCPSMDLSTKEAPGEQSPPRSRGASLMLFQLPTAALQEPCLISARKASVPAALKSAFPGGERDILPR